METFHYKQTANKMKKIKYNILVLLGFLVLASNVTAQNMSDMCINEFLVTNTDDFVNDFGHRTGWVELFNTSYGTVNIGGCYITNDPNNLTKYVIQRGDELTKIKPRQHILFWADGEPHRGTFHLNFTLKESKEIILVSSDGKTIIDRVEIPHELLSENVSYGRIKDGVTVMATKENQDVESTWAILDKTSPSTNNYGLDQVQPGVALKKVDPYGVIMAITAMSVVFLSLILLYFVFKGTGKYSIKKRRERAILASSDGNTQGGEHCDTPGEVYAAIATALHMHFQDDEFHDIESTILTIDKVTRNYSPWSSKIHTLRETPNRK